MSSLCVHLRNRELVIALKSDWFSFVRAISTDTVWSITTMKEKKNCFYHLLFLLFSCNNLPVKM